MLGLRGFLGSQIAVSGDLLGGTVLIDRPSVAGDLRRSLGVFPDRIVEFVVSFRQACVTVAVVVW